jgi:hypothetical protein
MVRYVVSRPAMVGSGCADSSRDFVFTRKLACCPDRDPRVEKGRITFGANEDRRELDGLGDDRLTHASDYVDVFGGALGSDVAWARLQVSCPSTKAVVFDSGEVRPGDAFCTQPGKVHLFLLEGHARRGATGACCPDHLKCPR